MITMEDQQGDYVVLATVGIVVVGRALIYHHHMITMVIMWCWPPWA